MPRAIVKGLPDLTEDKSKKAIRAGLRKRASAKKTTVSNISFNDDKLSFTVDSDTVFQAACTAMRKIKGVTVAVVEDSLDEYLLQHSAVEVDSKR